MHIRFKIIELLNFSNHKLNCKKSQVSLTFHLLHHFLKPCTYMIGSISYGTPFQMPRDRSRNVEVETGRF